MSIFDRKKIEGGEKTKGGSVRDNRAPVKKKHAASKKGRSAPEVSDGRGRKRGGNASRATDHEMPPKNHADPKGESEGGEALGYDTPTPDAASQYESIFYGMGAIVDLNARLRVVLWIALGVLFVTVITALVNVTIQARNAYIPVDEDYRVQYGAPAEKQFSSTDIEQFASKALLETFSFNYLNYQERLRSVFNTYYTESGANSLDSVLEQRNIFRYLQNRSLTIVDSRLEDNPVIIRQGRSESGAQAWVVDVNISLVLVTGQERSESYTFRLVVERMPPELRRSQLGVASVQRQ